MNKPKTKLSRLLFLVIMLTVITFSLLAAARLTFGHPGRRAVPQLDTNAAAAETNYRLPVRLKIPRISVDAQVDPMGLTSDGDMEAPVGPKNVGWYRAGPHPGESGSAVMDGHFGPWQDGEGSVFDDLSKLKKGDSLNVVNEKGVTTNFIVEGSQTFSKDADTASVFTSRDGIAHLNLITCNGAWDKVSKSYTMRLVVFANKKS